MDTQIFDDLNKTTLGLSITLGLQGGFSGQALVEAEVEAALKKRPLTDAQNDILVKAASSRQNTKLPNMAGQAFAEKSKGPFSARDIAHHFMDGIRKKVTNIGLYVGLGVKQEDDIKTVYENAVQLYNLASELQNQIPVILGYNQDSTLQKECKHLGKVVKTIHHNFLPALEQNIKAIEQVHGKMEVAPFPTSGAEFFKPIDIRAFREAGHGGRPTSTATYQQRGPESGSRTHPSRK